MNIGLIIGHFEPLHLGHLRDIHHATSMCDMLHIVITPKQGKSRFCPTIQDKARWVQVSCQHFDFVKVHTTDSLGVPAMGDYLDGLAIDDKLFDLIDGLSDTSALITLFVKDKIKNIVLMGQGLPNIINTAYLPNNKFDFLDIYGEPIRYFDHIAPSAKADYVQTVCIVGGESSGKTTLVHKLANHYGASFALEMGRLYTHSNLGGTEIGLQYSDYLPIAINHAHAIFEAKKNATAPIMLVDTDFATTQAFCEEYENRTHPVVAAMTDEIRMDFTIYLDNNVKWVADGMRRLGDKNQRSRFASRLLDVLARHKITPFIIDDEDYHVRYLQAVDFIDRKVLDIKP